MKLMKEDVKKLCRIHFSRRREGSDGNSVAVQIAMQLRFGEGEKNFACSQKEEEMVNSSGLWR